MSDLQLLLTIAAKDLRQELRSKAVTVATIFFSAIVLVILAFALGPEPSFLQNAAAGAIWVALAFAGSIAAAQSYQYELEEGALDQLLLYPIARPIIYLAKLLANWLFMLILAAVILPITIIMFKAEFALNPWLLITILLGTLGFAIIAGFYAALTANLRARESLLPVLMFPVIVPVLLAATEASDTLLQGLPLHNALSWLRLLAGFDLMYLVLCSAMFKFVIED
ncbi:MAG: heme exporter protein CcmB [Deinococcales bacterium]